LRRALSAILDDIYARLAGLSGAAGNSIVSLIIPTGPVGGSIQLEVIFATDMEFTQVVSTIDTAAGTNISAVIASDGNIMRNWPALGVDDPFYNREVVFDAANAVSGVYPVLYYKARFTQSAGGPTLYRLGMLKGVVGTA